MLEQETHIDQAKNAFAPMLTAAQKQFDTLTHAQSEWAKKAAEINQYWAERGRAEGAMVSEFASKLATAHSIPDAMAAWQEWSRQRFERMAEDGKHFAADVQDVMKAGAGLLKNGGGD